MSVEAWVIKSRNGNIQPGSLSLQSEDQAFEILDHRIHGHLEYGKTRAWWENQGYKAVRVRITEVEEG